MSAKSFDSGSFKDASNRVFWKENKPFRIIHENSRKSYKQLKNSNFFELAIEKEFLLDFEEISGQPELVLAPKKIDWISYPYEWTPLQLKDAALFHLDFLTFCMDHEVMIKDATPFNLQFVGDRLIFIDHGSFEPISGDFSWKAYKQFCETFVAPLLLSKYHQTNGCLAFRTNLEGIPLSETATQMPFRALFDGLFFFHIRAHSKFNGPKKRLQPKEPKIGKAQTLKIIQHLKVCIEGLTFNRTKSNWTQYDQKLPYKPEEIEKKKAFIASQLSSSKPRNIVDIGANHPQFLTLYPKGATCVLIDQDFQSVEVLYQKTKHLCLVQDITQPSPSLGLHLNERKSFFERIQADLIIGLALVHHLFHVRNIPLEEIIKIFAQFKCDLLVEYVDVQDEQFQLISNPENQHPYSRELFESCFTAHYLLMEKQEVKKHKRWVYHYQWKK